MLRVLFFLVPLLAFGGTRSFAQSPSEFAELFDQGAEALSDAVESASGREQILLGLLLADRAGNEGNAEDRAAALQRLPSTPEIERDYDGELATYARALHCAHQIRSGAIAAARPLCETSLAAVDGVSEPLLRSRIYLVGSLLAMRSGRLFEAIEPSQNALAAGRESKSRYAHASALNAIALTQLTGGLHEDALGTYETMREVASDLLDSAIGRVMDFNLGLAHLEAENYDEAIESFQRGVEWTRDTGQKHRGLIARSYLASAYQRSGQPQEARSILAEDIAQGGEGEDPDTYALALLVWSKALLAEGQTERALGFVEEGLRLVESLGNDTRRWQLQLVQARALDASARSEEALEIAQRVVAEHGDGQVTDELDDAYELIAQLAADQGLYELAYGAQKTLDALDRDNRGRRYELGVALLEKNHALANAERELESIESIKERETALRQRNTSLLAGLAAVLGLLILASSLNRSRREQHHIASQQKQMTEELEGLVTVRTEALEMEMVERMKGEEQRRDLEKQLAEADKLRALGQLTGGIAHDFNNLLTVVTSASEMLADEPDMPEDERAELVAAIRRAADSGRDVNRGLLAYARQQPLEPEPIDIAELLESSRKLFERTLGGEMKLETQSDHVTVLADRGKFTTALINLLLNARDASDGRGSVTLRARTRGTGLAEISVIDEGRGMSADELERAIEPFYSTKTSTLASGLGLSMVYGFVRQSGGDLDIQSQEGQGTHVTLVLPVAERREDAERSASARTHIPDGIHVLLVDDNHDVRDMVRRMLEGLKVTVDVAEDGTEGLRAFERRTPDVLISDVLMPGKINGLELADKAREIEPSVPILLISGYANEVDINYPLLQKPFSLGDLEQRILDLLNHEGPRRRTA